MPEEYALRHLDEEAMARLTPATLFDLNGKVAVVTGASGGLGSWISAGLAAAGAHVVIADHPTAPTDEVTRRIAASGGSVSSAQRDLLEPDAAGDLVQKIMEDFGRLDIVVNNAGINRREPILEVTDESWDLISRLDLKVPYDLSRAAASEMIKRGEGGSIIQIASLNNAIGLEGVSVYGAMKAGLAHTAKSMSVEWSRYGIRVNAICPGFMLTPLSQPLWRDERRGPWLLRRSPLRRPGYPEELVGACLLLASNAGSFITGQALYVDGGYLAGTPWDDPIG